MSVMEATKPKSDSQLKFSRKEIIDGCIEYFRSNQWKDLIQLVQEREMNHLHIFVDSCLDPHTSLTPLVRGYLARRGWDSDRTTMSLTNKKGQATLYGFYMPDKVHFDMMERFTTDTVLAPMPADQGERGGNLRVWWNYDVVRFEEQFDWRTSLTPAEEKELEAFFVSGKHWNKALEHVLDPDIMHVHCNVETSIHPLILRKFGMRDIARRGWKIAHCFNSMFNGGGYDSGKIIFMGTDPERTYDIAYYYNKNVFIQTNTQDTRFVGGDEGTGREFLIMRVSALSRELAQHKYLVNLTKDEINHILDVTMQFDHRSPYGWRFLPTGKVIK